MSPRRHKRESPRRERSPTYLQTIWSERKKISQLIRKRRRPLASRSWAQEFDSLMVLNVPCWHSGGMLQMLDPVAVWVYGLRCSRGRPRDADVCKAELFLPIGTERFFGTDFQGCFCSYLCALAFLIVTYINMKRAATFSVVLTQGHWEPFTWGEACLTPYWPSLSWSCSVCSGFLIFLFQFIGRKLTTFLTLFLRCHHIWEEPINSPARVATFLLLLHPEIPPKTRDENGS